MKDLVALENVHIYFVYQRLCARVRLVARTTMADQMPKRFKIPLSTAVGVSLTAGLDVVAAASAVGLEVEVKEASTLLDEEEVGALEDVLVGVADEVLASGSPSRLSRSV